MGGALFLQQFCGRRPKLQGHMGGAFFLQQFSGRRPESQGHMDRALFLRSGVAVCPRRAAARRAAARRAAARRAATRLASACPLAPRDVLACISASASMGDEGEGGNTRACTNAPRLLASRPHLRVVCLVSVSLLLADLSRGCRVSVFNPTPARRVPRRKKWRRHRRSSLCAPRSAQLRRRASPLPPQSLLPASRATAAARPLPDQRRRLMWPHCLGGCLSRAITHACSSSGGSCQPTSIV